MEEQKLLFEIIKTKMPEQFRLVDIVEELLNISSDSAYRRIRGETELSFGELRKLCEQFNLSIDEILLGRQSTHNALFRYTSVNMADQEGYITYMKRLAASLTMLKLAQEKELFFTAQDIPFYHFLPYLELTLFKLYAWNDTINRKPMSYLDFCKQMNCNALRSLYQDMTESYMHIPAKEIWTNQTVDTILRLLDYYIDIGAFEKKETVLLLLNQLTQLIDTVNKYAEDGCKGSEKNIPYSMYICHVDLENNFMLTKTRDQLSCNIKLYTINSLITDNDALCKETEKWIDDLISKSVLISGTSGKERFRFFQSSKNKIMNLISKVELIDTF